MKAFLLSLLAILSTASFAAAQNSTSTELLSPLFSENAVLQRDKPLPLWGQTLPNSRVEIELAGRKQSVLADASGQWRAVFEPFSAATGQKLRVLGVNQTQTRDNLAFGDVWLCSGQSNMQRRIPWSESQMKNPDSDIESARFPNIRFLTIPNLAALRPTRQFAANWQVCTPQNVRWISAVAYFFGRQLHQKTGVPIGLIDASWGGTSAKVWASAEALKPLPTYQEALLALENTRPDVPISQQNAAYFARFDNGVASGFTALNFEDSGWKTTTLPQLWEKSGDAQLQNFDGLVWYRKRIEIPENLRGLNAKIRIGSIDDADMTWWNGEQIGATFGREKAREYELTSQQLGSGGALSIRVFDAGGTGGISGKMEMVFSDGSVIDLGGEWRVQSGAPKSQMGEPPVNIGSFPSTPSVVFNSMIAPLTPAAIKGVIWYQGESDAAVPEDYVPLLKAMIADWRARFSGGEFPFYQVQLAGFMAPTDDANTPRFNWAWIRESQLKIARETPQCDLVTAIDIGEQTDIHPRNKLDVGLRLAQLALRRDYGLEIESQGPSAQRVLFQDGAALLKLDGAKGVRIEGEATRVFALAGQDKKWFWATPQILDDQIILRAPEVPNPVAVRFAWQNFPRAHVYNDFGWPMMPFRTDNWAR